MHGDDERVGLVRSPGRRRCRRLISFVLVVMGVCVPVGAGQGWDGFEESPWFGERVRYAELSPDVRVLVVAPAADTFDAGLPTRVVFFATPNGNTIEQTVGCAGASGRDWHDDIQHIGAQVRVLRGVRAGENIVLMCAEARGLSWPAWRRAHVSGGEGLSVRAVVSGAVDLLPVDDVRVTLACHSGGGSLLWGYIEDEAIDGGAIAAVVDQIIWLDANYSFADAHGDRLIAWLREGDANRLCVIAYDDREIMLNGKRVVGPTGGTYRATRRMLRRFGRDVELTSGREGAFETFSALGGRVRFLIHDNRENIILHTRLVGEMNGLLHAMTIGTGEEEVWGEFGGPRAYTSFVQPLPFSPSLWRIPARPAGAMGGGAFMRSIDGMSPAARERAIVGEIVRGNIPDRLRRFRAVTLRGVDGAGVAHEAVVRVMPDYLAVGNDGDSVRVPMTPMSAQAIADAFCCVLPTARLVDAVHAQADGKVEPRPLTEDRESVASFVRHDGIIDGQLGDGGGRGLVSGIKKDIVLPAGGAPAGAGDRVVIYGWHHPDGRAVQPLYAGHHEGYVDYSHGVRLVHRVVGVDGVELDIAEVLRDPRLCVLLSDDGPMATVRYRLVGEGG